MIKLEQIAQTSSLKNQTINDTPKTLASTAPFSFSEEDFLILIIAFLLFQEKKLDFFMVVILGCILLDMDFENLLDIF